MHNMLYRIASISQLHTPLYPLYFLLDLIPLASPLVLYNYSHPSDEVHNVEVSPIAGCLSLLTTSSSNL